MMIKDWKKAHKMNSVRWAIVIVLINSILVALQLSLPEFKVVISDIAYAVANSILGVGVMVTRVLKQASLGVDDDNS